MANYDANIRVSADTTAAERALRKLTAEVDKLQGLSKGITGIKNIGEAFVPQRALTRLEKGLQTIVERANTTEKAFARVVEGVGTLAASGAALEGLNSVLKQASVYAGEVAANFSGADRKIDAFSATGDTLKTVLASINNSLVDVSHAIARSVVPGFSVLDDSAHASAQGINAAQNALQRLLDNSDGLRTFVENFGSMASSTAPATAALAALAAVLEGQLSQSLYDIESASGTALKQLAADAQNGVSELQRLIHAGQGTVAQYEALIQIGKERLAQHRSDSDEARKAANTITQGQRLLNAELERQNDLLREARGLRPQSVENRATNTYNVNQRRKNFFADVQSGVDGTLQAALALDQTLADLDQHLADVDAADAERKWTALTKQWEEADITAAALAKRLDDLRRSEQAASEAARTRLGNGPLQPYDDGGVKRRTTAGVAYPQGAGPAASPTAVEGSVVNQVRREAQLREDTARLAYEYQREYQILLFNQQIDIVEAELKAELDKIDAIGAAQKKANEAALKDFDRRLAQRGEAKATAQDKRNAFNQKAESLALGVGFPLLFGGGPGSVLGAAAGSFVGSGFGGQILGGAIGQSLDQFITGLTTLGQSLKTPTAALDAMDAAGLKASDSLKYNVKQLEEAGRAYEAQALVLAELKRQLGPDAIRQINALTAQQKQLQDNWQGLTAAIASSLLPALIGATALINDISTALAGLATIKPPEWLRNAVNTGINAAVPVVGGLQTLGQTLSARGRQETAKQSNTVPLSQEVKDQALRARATTLELQAQAELLSKQLSLTGLTLEKDGARYVNAARAVALQEYENKLLQIRDEWVGKTFDKEQNLAKIRSANLEYAAKLKQLEAEVAAKREASASAALAIDKEMLQLYGSLQDMRVQEVQMQGGEEAGLKERLAQQDARVKNGLKIFSIEKQQALLEAQKNGTVIATNALLDYRSTVLVQQWLLEKKQTEEKLRQLQLDKYMAQQKAISEAAQPFVEFRQQQELDQQYAKDYLRLVTEGMLPAEAERIANFNRLTAQQLISNGLETASVENALAYAKAQGAVTIELEAQLTRLKAARGEIQNQAKAGPGKGKSNQERIGDALSSARTELNNLIDPVNQVIAGANAIGDAFQEAFKGLVSGAMTGQEALASFFKGVGAHFVDMATQMIAKMIEIWILQQVIGLFGGAAGGKAGAPDRVANFNAGVASYGFADGGYLSGGFQAFANGGMATRPTLGLVGEGGQAEYIIPAGKMRESMRRYASGTRGSAVIPAGNDTSSPAAAGAPVATPIDVRYSVSRINSVDYVTADQFQQGLQQAAAQGAARGEQSALRRLQQSRATRNRLGLG